MKKILTVLLVVLIAVPAIAGDIEIGGAIGPQPAPDGFLYVLLNGIWSLISLT